MNDLLVDITPEHYETYATEGTSPWNAYLKERILEEAASITSPRKKILDIGISKHLRRMAKTCKIKFTYQILPT